MFGFCFVSWITCKRDTIVKLDQAAPEITDSNLYARCNQSYRKSMTTGAYHCRSD